MSASDDPATIVSGSAGASTSPTAARAALSSELRRHAAGNIGRYLIIDEIGRGGMGVVLRAYDPRLQREVALKTVRTDALSAEAQAQMLHEAQAMAKLSHPNVVAIYDVEIAADEVVLAMEYVRGQTLQAWLAQKQGSRRSSWKEVVEIFCAAGRGLAAAHQAGLLHRDFKPGNVLVGDDERVRVTDFGLAHAHAGPSSIASKEVEDAQSERADVVLGTPRYMAPEQHEGQPLAPAADQYAFCVALWEGLTGATPFPNAAEHKLTGPPPWPRDTNVPVAVQRAIARGLAPQPEDRWPSMQALLEQLARASGQQRRWAAVGGVVTLSIASGLAWAGYRQHLGELCSGSQRQLASIWDAARKEAVRHAFAATNVGYAEATWARVVSRLDDYAATWAAMHTDACKATTVRAEQPAAVMDLRMACLHRAKVDLRAVTSVFAEADVQVIENAHQVVSSLPNLDRCADVVALQAEVAPPAPAEADAVESLRVELADIEALRESGKYPLALERVQALAERAGASSYAPVRIELLIELATCLENNGRYDDAQRTFVTALRASLSSKMWSPAVTAATHLVHIVGDQQTRPAEGLAFAETAKGLVRRVDAVAVADLRTQVGNALRNLGRYAEAEAEHRSAIALAQRAPGSNDFSISIYRNNLSTVLTYQGRLQEALDETKAQLDVRLRELGPDHPYVATARFELANTLHGLGRYAEAEAEHRLALVAWEETLGRNHFVVGMTKRCLATAIADQGRNEEAEAMFIAAIEVLRTTLGPDHVEVALAKTGLAEVVADLGRVLEAEALAREALGITEKTLGADGLHATVTRSLLTSLLVRQGRHREAEGEARRALKALQTSEGRRSQHMVTAHLDLGNALAGQRRYDEAEGEYRTAVSIATDILGHEHPHTINSLARLDRLLEQRGRHEASGTDLRSAADL